jgi:hypothetical protein
MLRKLLSENNGGLGNSGRGSEDYISSLPVSREALARSARHWHHLQMRLTDAVRSRCRASHLLSMQWVICEAIAV